MAKSRKSAYFMISAVAEQYQLHPQTLRLYEREVCWRLAQRRQYAALHGRGFRTPGSDSQADARAGCEPGGVEIILNMREKMGEMQRQIETFVQSLNTEMTQRARPAEPAPKQNSLIPFVDVKRTKKSG